MDSVFRLTDLTPLLSVSEIKQNLSIDHSDDDALLMRLSLAVTDLIDGHSGESGVATVPQSIRWVTDFRCGEVEAPVGPIVQVTDAVGIDHDGQDITGSIAVVRSNISLSRVRIPEVTGTRPCMVKILYDAGPVFNLAPPPAIVEAAHLMVGHYYENRENSVPIKLETIPECAKNLIYRHKRGWAA